MLVFPKLTGRNWDRKKVPTFNTAVRTATSGARGATAFMPVPRFAYEFSYDYLPNDNTNPLYGTSDMKALAGLYLNCQGRAKTFLYHDNDDYHVVGGAIGTGNGVTTQWPFVAPIMGGSPIPVGQVDQSTLFTFLSTAVNTATSRITIPNHGLTTGQYPPMFISNSGGTLPTPLAAQTPYWPIVVDANTIQLAATAGGGAITLTAAGTGTNVLAKGFAVYDNGTISTSVSLLVPNQIVFGTAPVSGHVITADFDYYFVCRFDADTLNLNEFVNGWWNLDKINFSTEVT